MGLDMYYQGRKELSPKRKKERLLIGKLNQYPFTQSNKKELSESYMYISEWSDKPLYEMVNEFKLYGQIGHIKGLQCSTDKAGRRKWTIITESHYLRKSNHIHKWFVDNAQDGVDDCGNYPIDDVLEKFIEQASAVIIDPTKAAEIMPTQDGFFFGGTDYDKYYFNELRFTIKVFKQMLRPSSKNYWKYEYSSSW
jgi:hypothetical protein